MEESYNWDLILKVSLPVALLEAYVFYANIRNFWKWAILVLGLLVVGFIIYWKDKKKHNIFTAAAIVFLAAMIIRFFKNFGLF